MAVTQYIGSRYVPIFADPIEWSSANTYEPLTIVLHEGNSYTSRQAVPKGIDISNEAFWALTGNYNAQVELYRRETAAAKAAADDAQTDIDTLLPKSDFSAENTVKQYVDSSIAQVAEILPSEDFSAEMTVKKYVDDGFVSNEKARIDSMQSRMLALKPILRPEISNAELYSTQGFCVFDSDRYVAIGATSEDDSLSKLFVFNAASGVKVSETILPMGHCNTLSERDNMIVVADGAGKLLVIDVSNPRLPFVTNQITIPSGINTVCWYTTDKVLGVAPLSSTDFRFIVIDVVTSEITYSDTAYNNVLHMIPQGLTYDGKYIYRSYSDYNNVLVFDGADFSLVDSFTVPSNIGYIKVGELEQVYLTEKGVYICSNTHMRDSLCIMPLVAVSYFNDTNESAFPESKIDSAIVNKDTGYNIVSPNQRNASNVFKYFEDALNSGATSITVQSYSDPIEIRYSNLTMTLQSGCTSQIVLAHTHINLICEDSYFTDEAPASNSISLLNNQLTQVYLYRCTGSITVNASGDLRELLIQKLVESKTFQFVFRDCTMNCTAGMMGFACNESILTADLFTAPYFIKDNNTLRSKNMQVDQNSPCLIYGDNDIRSNTVAMRRVGASNFSRAVASADILPIVFAHDLRALTQRFTFEYNKNDVNPTISNYGVRVPLGLSSNNKLVVFQFMYNSEPWPTQLTDSNVIVNGVSVTYGNLAWNADGTSLTPVPSLDNHVFMD